MAFFSSDSDSGSSIEADGSYPPRRQAAGKLRPTLLGCLVVFTQRDVARAAGEIYLEHALFPFHRQFIEQSGTGGESNGRGFMIPIHGIA